MMEFLKWMFQGPWTFLGMIILIGVIGQTMVELVKALLRSNN